MPELISKLQYKNFKKGEYAEEKPRSLEETLQEIKQFPWGEQRGVEISLTGPSLTICDDNGNYLKAALYFNGKYCVYYFDVSHHLYEYHTENLDDVCEQVSNFFDGQIALNKYEKQLFSIGAKSHFENGTFDYQMSDPLIFFYIFIQIVTVCAFTGFAAFVSGPGVPSFFMILPLFFIVLCILSVFITVLIYRKASGIRLSVTRGSDQFQVWQNNILTEYKKEDVATIKIYGSRNRSSAYTLAELLFSDNTRLIIPGVIIDPDTLAAKFPNLTPDYSMGSYLTSKIFWTLGK